MLKSPKSGKTGSVLFPRILIWDKLRRGVIGNSKMHVNIILKRIFILIFIDKMWTMKFSAWIVVHWCCLIIFSNKQNTHTVCPVSRFFSLSVSLFPWRSQHQRSPGGGPSRSPANETGQYAFGRRGFRSWERWGIGGSSCSRGSLWRFFR